MFELMPDTRGEEQIKADRLSMAQHRLGIAQQSLEQAIRKLKLAEEAVARLLK